MSELGKSQFQKFLLVIGLVKESAFDERTVEALEFHKPHFVCYFRYVIDQCLYTNMFAEMMALDSLVGYGPVIVRFQGHQILSLSFDVVVLFLKDAQEHRYRNSHEY